jgi:hypothetical protein
MADILPSHRLASPRERMEYESRIKQVAELEKKEGR